MRGKSNLTVINMDRVIRIMKNTIVMFCSTFAEMDLPFIFSINKNISFPPSSAGMGNKLKIARKMEIIPIK